MKSVTVIIMDPFDVLWRMGRMMGGIGCKIQSENRESRRAEKIDMEWSNGLPCYYDDDTLFFFEY